MLKMQGKAIIKISPSSALIDEDIKVLIEGLHPSVDITLMCRVKEQTFRYFSWAYYTSDEKGCVDLTTMSALPGGSYDGLEPMGFVWSQKQEPGQKPGCRLVKHDVTTPLVTRFYALQGLMDPNEGLQSVNSGHWLAHTLYERSYMADGVKRIEVRDGRLVGTLFIPSVIYFFSGNYVSHYCFAKDKDLIQEGIQYLLGHPRVRKPFVGIIGVSKGGELALLISSLCHQIRACVEINGMDMVTLVGCTYKGETFPCFFADVEHIRETNEGLFMRDVYSHVTPEEYKKCSIPVERGQCDYLLIHSGDDQSMTPIATERIPKRLEHNHKSNYGVLMYPEAGHLIEPPYSPHFYSTYHSLFNNLTVWGGTGKVHNRAQQDAWREVLHFFRSKLVDKVQYLQNKL
ncbi:hypothetical protein LSH36_37g11018 [Paralvinella palmiformis]|uniref:Uncharacterized protein n=1 Tax=Paralvinella palmiformis TaxID=53620 RepID=A0AAD9NFG2_9ANNE|nr:hypothetical protein LSH36_37g11018 [Paralvinella palmiformis]